MFFSIFFDVLNKRKKWVISISFFMFFILAGIRYKTGFDWDDYMQFYNLIGQTKGTYIEEKFPFEPAFVYLNKIFKYTNLDYIYMQVITSLLCTISFYKFILERSKFPMTSLYIYYNFFYLMLNMGVVRQYIAISILFYSYKYIIEKKFLKYILIVSLATLFHRMSFIWIFVYFYPKIKIKKSILIFIILLLFSLYLANINISLIIIEKIKFLFSGNYEKKIDIYLYGINQVSSAKMKTGMGVLSYVLFNLILIFFKKNKTVDERIIENIALTSIVIKFLSMTLPILTRVNLYFEVYLVIFYTYYIEIFCKKYIRGIILLLFYLYLCIPWYEYYKSGTFKRIIPYYSSFNPVDNYEREKIETSF